MGLYGPSLASDRRFRVDVPQLGHPYLISAKGRDKAYYAV